MRNRNYHPDLGRWLQRDPLGYVDGMSLYEYVRGNPLKFLDPFGLLSLLTSNRDCTHVTHTAIVVGEGENKRVLSYEGNGWNEYGYDEYLKMKESQDILLIELDDNGHTNINEDRVIEYVENHSNDNEPEYHLTSNNCSQNAAQALDYASDGDYSRSVGYNTDTPRNMHDNTEQQYAPEQMVQEGTGCNSWLSAIISFFTGK